MDRGGMSSIERAVQRRDAWDERGFIKQFVSYIEDCFEAYRQNPKAKGRFLLGLSVTDGAKRRKRTAEIFSTLAESQKVKWDRLCIFLVDERYKTLAEEDTNTKIVRSAFSACLSEDRLVLPNTTLDTVERCAADYQARLLKLFEDERSNGPDLVVLSLGSDLSLSGVFPSWYAGNPENWSIATSKTFRVLTTSSPSSTVADHICINLGVIRRSRNIIVDDNEITAEDWQRIEEGFDANAVVEDHAPHGRTRSEPRRPGRASSRSYDFTPGRRTDMRHGLLSPPARQQSPPRVEAPSVTVTPLNYLLKWNQISAAQVRSDEGHYYTFIILGAAGDLAMKKTFPALFQLQLGNHLPSSCRIIGCDNTNIHKDVQSSEDLWSNRLSKHLEKETNWKPYDLRDFKSRIDFVPVNFDEAGTMRKVDAHIKELAKGHRNDNRVCYLALPSFLFTAAVQRFHTECSSETGFSRVIVEKPFGRNHSEAQELARNIGRYLDESQIYRIDHYLAKSLVLNILTLRFANREFGTLFHTYHVANVRITFQEDFGVQGRAGYFNDYGIIRDIMQNHLMQVLTLVAMEAPASLEAEDVRDEKVKVLKQIRPIRVDDCVIGQYEGYQDDPAIQKINKQKGYPSRCPTFAACVLYLDNERWSGVPFIMKAGKALKKTQTIVRIQFKKAPSSGLFGDQPQNEMVIRIQPNEAIYYKMLAKLPGLAQKARDVRRTNLDLDLKKGLGNHRPPEAYEKLIYDVMQGESHNFVRADELEQAWRIFDPLLHELEADEEKGTPSSYKYGSGGPKAADELIKSLGFQKYTPTGMAVQGFSDDE
mmetsp:Transcript_79309/g.137511  ORF Transcript_79309/g.137511 Transcript_79309/m.137511 type:complete len:820 (-) Transcript_79309:182-2641(-)